MILVQFHTGNSGPEGAEIPVGRKFRPLHTRNSGLVQRAEVPLNPSENAYHFQHTAKQQRDLA